MHRYVTPCFVFLFCIVVIPFVSAQHDRNAEDSGSGPSMLVPTPVYILQPNDVLEIFVWKEPELTRKVIIRPDRRISFPLIQDMQVAALVPRN